MEHTLTPTRSGRHTQPITERTQEWVCFCVLAISFAAVANTVDGDGIFEALSLRPKGESIMTNRWGRSQNELKTSGC